MARGPKPLAFLLDEDVSPEVAVVARGLGLDVVSVHEVGRRGLSDFEQLRLAAADGRVFVTRNRDDYITLTVESFRAGDAHHGVLIIPYTLPNTAASRVARALERWHRGQASGGHPGPYFIDFVG